MSTMNIDESYTSELTWEAMSEWFPKGIDLVDPFQGERFSKWAESKGFQTRRVPGCFWKALEAGLLKDAFIVTNPPYTLKEEVLMEFVERQMPFLILVPFSLLYMATMNKIEHFKLMIWGYEQKFTKPDGKQISAKEVAIYWTPDLKDNELKYITGPVNERPTIICSCGCRVKTRTKKRHEATVWHMENC